MSKLKPFLFGAILGAGAAVFALQFHVVHSHEGIRVVARTPQPSLGLAFADVRDWDAEKWADRPELVRALVANGSKDLIAKSVADSALDAAAADSGTLDRLRGFLNDASSVAEPDAAQTDGLRVPGDTTETDEEFENLFSLPFPSEARSAKRPQLASRETGTVTDVPGSGLDGSPQAVAADKIRSGKRARAESDAEADLLEGFLFGDDETPGGLASGPKDFVEDVSRSFQERTDQTLRKAQEQLRSRTNDVLDRPFRAAEDYLQGSADTLSGLTGRSGGGSAEARDSGYSEGTAAASSESARGLGQGYEYSSDTQYSSDGRYSSGRTDSSLSGSRTRSQADDSGRQPLRETDSAPGRSGSANFGSSSSRSYGSSQQLTDPFGSESGSGFGRSGDGGENRPAASGGNATPHGNRSSWTSDPSVSSSQPSWGSRPAASYGEMRGGNGSQFRRNSSESHGSATDTFGAGRSSASSTSPGLSSRPAERSQSGRTTTDSFNGRASFGSRDAGAERSSGWSPNHDGTESSGRPSDSDRTERWDRNAQDNGSTGRSTWSSDGLQSDDARKAFRSADDRLPAPLRALRDGFDPFAE